MERDSFKFAKSYYDAIKRMPYEVQAEIYPALVEYALFGKQPKTLSDIAMGVFTLIKPTIDVNTTRYKNGKKGGEFGMLGGRPPKKRAVSTPAPAPAAPAYSKEFSEEVEQMKHDTIWLEQGVCMKFSITQEEAVARLGKFLSHCYSECADKPHKNYGDAQRHFCSWMRKTYKADKSTQQTDLSTPPDYTFNGGFGGADV